MASPNRLRNWQILTMTLMVLGYSGYYLCRSNFSVALPLIIDDLARRGMNPDEAKIRLGAIASLGVLAYALGKFVAGGIADFIGGRRNFLAGMGGSVLFTVAFALGGGLPIFTLAWVANRAVQSLGWVGMVKVSSRWYGFSTYGTMMGILSLSYLFGDAASRAFMSLLIAHGVGWREVFFVAAGVLFLLLLLNALLLKESPKEIGESEPHANPLNLFGDAGEEPRPVNLGKLLGPLLRSPAFLCVCALSLGMTLIRETFNTWTPTYLTQAVGLTKAAAAGQSALFPLFGGVSVLVAGFLSDRLGRGGRAALILAGMALTTVALVVLGRSNLGGSTWAPILLISVIALLLLGPYSYLAGALSLDFGGKHGCSTACGIIDGFGYLAGVLAGDAMARLSVTFGWQGAFLALAGVAALSGIAAALFLFLQIKRPIVDI